VMHKAEAEIRQEYKFDLIWLVKGAKATKSFSLLWLNHESWSATTHCTYLVNR